MSLKHVDLIDYIITTKKQRQSSGGDSYVEDIKEPSGGTNGKCHEELDQGEVGFDTKVMIMIMIRAYITRAFFLLTPRKLSESAKNVCCSLDL